MNRRSILKAYVVATCLVGLAAPGTQAHADEEARIITSVDELPELNRRRAVGRDRIVVALKDLPAGFRLRVILGTYYDQGHSHSTGGLEPYVKSIVPLDAEGRMNGEEREWQGRDTRPVRTTSWVNDTKHGIETLRAAEVPWVNGRIHGVRKTFFRNGAIESETPYHEGLQHGTAKSFDEGGNVTRECTMRHGKRHGTLIDYWPETGAKRRILKYDDGAVHGTVREYYSNGQLRREVPFVNDLMHGEEKRFTEDGEPERSRFWISGDQAARSEFELRFGR